MSSTLFINSDPEGILVAQVGCTFYRRDDRYFLIDQFGREERIYGVSKEVFFRKKHNPDFYKRYNVQFGSPIETWVKVAQGGSKNGWQFVAFQPPTFAGERVILPTPTPSPTSAPQLSTTPTPTPTVTESPTPTSTAEATPAPTPEVTPTPTPSPTSEASTVFLTYNGNSSELITTTFQTSSAYTVTVTPQADVDYWQDSSIGNGLMVIAGRTVDNVGGFMVSADNGSTWTVENSSVGAGSWESVCKMNDTFIAAGSGNVVARSQAGIWNLVGTSSIGGIIRYDSVHNRAVIQNESEMSYSDDLGVNWSAPTVVPTVQNLGVTVGNGIWIRFAQFVSEGQYSGYVSVDMGENWTPMSFSAQGTNYNLQITYATGTFSAVVHNTWRNVSVYTSTDGLNWENHVSEFNSGSVVPDDGDGLNSAATDGTLIIAVPFYSVDGMTFYPAYVYSMNTATYRWDVIPVTDPSWPGCRDVVCST